MTSDQPPSSAGTPPGENRRRKAPTIDLTATEIESAAAQAAEAAPSTGTQSPGTEQSTQPAGASSDQAESAPPRRTMWLPDTTPWPSLAAGMAGGACIALLFLVASLFIARDGEVSGLDARIARLEGDLRDAPSHSLSAGTAAKRRRELA